MRRNCCAGRCLATGYLQRWGWVYCLLCYGAPFAMALAHLYFRQSKADMAGVHKEGWCWKAANWKMLIYIAVWACVFASFMIYLGVGIHIWDGSRKRRQSWADVKPNRRSSSQSHLGPKRATESRNSTYSLSDWPLSPHSGDRYFSEQGTCIKASGISASIARPPPARTSSAASSTWLSNFALSPRPAPTPPPPKRISAREVVGYFVIRDVVARVHLWTGLLFAISLFVTWLPGTGNIIWELVHPEQESPFGFRAAVATVLPIHGVWNAVIFFVMNWGEFVKVTGGKRHARGGITGLLEEPGLGVRDREMRTEGDEVEKTTKRELKVVTPWHMRRPRSDGWDFVDIGIPSRAATVVRPRRANSDPGLTPLLPTCPVDWVTRNPHMI
ncbi:hypothetical protein C8A00DRAFT_47637 [Chaetomidium leptoderma]|uniref:Uncharacterized protein n=1 Tax=Chaetomidium leptoderma TaxID=669021 RepID=A0AAN6VDH4_9PEZI|nr:hypothetical protein C8A00DRAFT_47637 [Chaetomidium leptoderma]